MMAKKKAKATNPLAVRGREAVFGYIVMAIMCLKVLYLHIEDFLDASTLAKQMNF